MEHTFYKANGVVAGSPTVLFWRVGDAGYTSNLDEAEIYTREEMQKEADNKWFRGDEEVPLSVSLVNEVSQWRVDSQYVDLKEKVYPTIKDPNDEYVAVLRRHWCGNDLIFSSIREISGRTSNYESAHSFNEAKIKEYMEESSDFGHWVIVPKYLTDEVARRTFQKENIDRRKMITAAGVTGVHKERKRSTTSKVPMNCPECGRINWQYDPHQFDECANNECVNYGGMPA